LDTLSQNTRHNVRRGLKRCKIQKVSADILANEGYETYIEAFNKYETFIQPESPQTFKENILSKYDDPKWDFWAVWNQEGKMIAYSINEIYGTSCSYATTKFHPNYLKLYPSDSLFFTMNTYYINEKKMEYINDGPRSLSHKTNIQEYFINKFNFRKAFCRMHVHYSIKIKFLVIISYPFKNIIKLLNLNISNKLLVLLKHEEIKRYFVKRQLYFYSFSTKWKINLIEPSIPIFIEHFKPSILKLKKHRGRPMLYLFWYLFTFGKYSIFYAKDSTGKVLHYSHTIPNFFKFPFLNKKDLQIGPCWTDQNHRGKNIYPAVLTYIINFLNNKIDTFYIITDYDNVSSQKGIIKSGFELFALGYKKGLLGVYKSVQSLK
jgi:hypothetical protein